MPVNLRDPAVLLERIDGADRELRIWFLLLVTWRAAGLALDGGSMAPFMAQGKRLESLKEEISKVGKRARATDPLFKDVLLAMEAQHELEGTLWELAAQFSEQSGLKGWSVGIPPEWR